MDLSSIKKVHLIGIGGIGISAIAKFLFENGKQVTGSDVEKSIVIDRLNDSGIKVVIGHNESNISEDIDLVIYSVAVPEDNIERLKVREFGIKEITYGEFLGELSLKYKTIAVTGTNGKTTTSSLLGSTYVDFYLDPTVIIGSLLNKFKGNLHLGSSEYLIVEADEYKANMLKVDPTHILLTSIEEDHLDFYKDIDDIIQHFQKFVDKLPEDGYLIYNGDDVNIKKLYLPDNSISCGKDDNSDYYYQDLVIKDGQQKFKVYYKSKLLDDFNLTIPGEYNVLNSLMVIALSHKLKLNLKDVKESLIKFNGLWRRYETVGMLEDNVLLISDYTHHPDAIIKTLKASKDFYPDRRLFLVYQPHQHDRTKKLFKDFVKAFDLADFTILHEIYDVAGRKYSGDEKVSSNDIVKEINKDNVIYSDSFEKTKELINSNLKPNDLLLVMGAGEIDKIARELYAR